MAPCSRNVSIALSKLDDGGDFRGKDAEYVPFISRIAREDEGRTSQPNSAPTVQMRRPDKEKETNFAAMPSDNRIE